MNKYRGKGYAYQIMQKAIDYVVHTWGENRIKIQAQQYLKEFYSSLGFKQTTNVYLEDGIPHINMLLKRE